LTANTKITTSKDGSTPMLRQYWEIKKRFPEHVLFYRMGDFYEMFFDDAAIAHKVLGITMTSRGQQSGEDVPLAGFPYHAIEGHLSRMVRGGYKVAICEQIEDPKKAKGIVKRDVVEVVTAGTNLTESIIGKSENNFIAALKMIDDRYALAWADVSTGEFVGGEYNARDIELLLSSLAPAEIVIPRGQAQRLSSICKNTVQSKYEDWFFDYASSRRDLLEFFETHSLKGFGIEELPGAVSVCGALLSYVKENLRQNLAQFSGIRQYSVSKQLLLDPSTRRNLELVHSMSGPDGPTLLKVMDKTVTPMGKRLLVNWLWKIPCQVSEIESRQNAIEDLLEHNAISSDVLNQLKGICDIERVVAKLAASKANARDLRNLASSLSLIPGILSKLSEFNSERLDSLSEALDPLPDVLSSIEQTIAEDPPLSIAGGGIIRDGLSSELDELRELMTTGKQWLRGFEKQERERTGIPNLKIKFNRVFGYHIEISKGNLAKAPDDYVRRQTLVNAERFITDELKNYEERALGAEEKALALELEIFQKAVERLRPHFRTLQLNSSSIAQLDVLLSLSELARLNKYNKPQIKENGELHLRAARHPVIEKVLPPGENFVANDVALSNGREQIILLTGPNMAGKSTYLRMIGLITLMAHMGSYVPAEQATIPLRDRIFTRVGASDNLAQGESTFLVEMNEASFILRSATDRSLVLLDEIGRGTSTFDGLSLAWAITEYLHDHVGSRALTLFATHYHELVDLETSLVRLRNYNILVKQYGDNIVFTRQVIPGGCSHSYGIDVARMAGLPRKVINRAKEVLVQLENQEFGVDLVPSLQKLPEKTAAGAEEQLTLFSTVDMDLREKIRDANVDSMTPLMAMEFLIELRKSIGAE
jgi:DNA mismatch repair protein MutS